MKKIIELLRKFTTAIGITDAGVHTFYSLLLAIVFFYAGMWFDSGGSVWTGFLAGIVCTTMLGIIVEFGQYVFKVGTASIDDVLKDFYGSLIGSTLLLILNLVYGAYAG